MKQRTYLHCDTLIEATLIAKANPGKSVSRDPAADGWAVWGMGKCIAPEKRKGTQTNLNKHPAAETEEEDVQDISDVDYEYHDSEPPVSDAFDFISQHATPWRRPYPDLRGFGDFDATK